MAGVADAGAASTSESTVNAARPRIRVRIAQTIVRLTPRSVKRSASPDSDRRAWSKGACRPPCTVPASRLDGRWARSADEEKRAEQDGEQPKGDERADAGGEPAEA